MTETTTEDETQGLDAVVRVPRRLWRDLLSVYYANTPIWRWLKSGTLVFFGFALWSGAALLMSYRTDWAWLTYVMAYGFVLIVWGPLTHFVIVPLAIRLRRTARHPIARTFARHASKLNVSAFLAIVLVIGTAPIAPMMLDFQSVVPGDDRPDVGADVDCAVEDELVSCHVVTDSQVDHVVALSGERQLDRADGQSPYALEFHRNDVDEAVGQGQYAIELRDEEGDTLRRFVETVPVA